MPTQAMESLQNAATTAGQSLKRTLGPAPSTDAYISWKAPGVETVKGDEEAKALKIGEKMKRMQKHNFDQHRHAFRATHVKTQAIVKGTLTIPSDLPKHLQQGLFAHPGTYPVAARYANEPVFLQPDTAPGPRGLGLKVFNVPGERIEVDGNSNLTTQDFTMNNAPMLELTDIDTCLEIMQLREKYFDSPNQLSLATKTRTDALKQSAPGMLPNTNIISMPMFTQSAFRFGEYYGHIGLFPATETMRQHTESVPSDAQPTILSDWLVDFYANNEAKYDVKIQLGTDPVHHPTEDASIVWDEKTAPWQTIGSMVFHKQADVMGPERRTFWEERMRLDPWRGLEAHRPLGSVNRLRKWVYGQSQQHRAKLNANKNDFATTIDDIP